MAETVGDHVLAAVTGVGGRAGLRLPRRRDQRHRRRRSAAPTTRRRSSSRGTRRCAALQAVGYAKFSGKVGVCLATCGPARSTCSTVCTTRNSTTCRSSPSSGRPSAARWAAPTSRRSTCRRCSRTWRASTSSRSTCPSSCRWRSTARSGRPCRAGPDGDHHPERPAGRAVQPAEARVQAGPVQPAAAARADGRRPTPPRLARAAEVLNAGQRVAILVGQGARGAADEVAQVADVLGAGSRRRCSARTC